MPNRVRLHEPEPVEDLAIDNLLEIDLEEKEPISWEEKVQAVQKHPKRRHHSSNKLYPNKHSKNVYQPRQRHKEQPIFQKRRNLSDLVEFQQTSRMLISDLTVNNAKSSDFNEGEYWSSRVNWMQQNSKKEPFSQTRLNKKYSFGYEVNGRKGDKGAYRYEVDEKNRKEQYKTNMIYSLLHQEQGLVKAKSDYDRVCSSLGQNKRSQSNSSHLLNKYSKNQRVNCKSKDQSSVKISSLLQLNMRQTLKKLYFKNHHQQNIDANSPFKHSQQERSTMVRQLLNNLQSMKESENIRSACKEQKKQIKIIFQEQTPFIPYALKKPQKKYSKVVNINIQAEKIYQHKGTNRWNGKKPIILLQVQ